MKVLNIDEQEDGSAIVNVDLTDDEVQLLLEHSIVSALKNYIKEKEDDIE